MAKDLGVFEYAPNRIFRLKVLAIYADINIDDIYDDYEEARHDYDRENDDKQEDWQGLTRYQEVLKILNELEIK